MKFSPAIGVLAALAMACSSSPSSNESAHAMDGGAVDASSTDAGSSMGDGGGEVAAPGAVCLESPSPRPGVRPILTVTVTLTYAGQPIVFGEPFALTGGGTLMLSDFRFYVSEFGLLRNGSEPAAVDIVASDGRPLPYNIHLVNAEKEADMTFRLAVPAGDYTGASFLFGITDACNHREPDTSQPPLGASSELSWPQPFGYLFFRYEGMIMGAAGNGAPPAAVAMGGLPGLITAPRVNASGAVHVADGSSAARLRVELSELFRATGLPAEPPNPDLPGGPEMEAGEHLRQNAAKVTIFSLTGGP